MQETLPIRENEELAAPPDSTAEAGGEIISLILQQVSLLVISDGLLGSACTSAFVARGFSAHYGSENGQVSFDHTPNAGLEEVADRIEERTHGYDAIVLFFSVQRPPKHGWRLRGRACQVRHVELHEEALRVLAQDVCLPRRARRYSVPMRHEPTLVRGAT